MENQEMYKLGFELALKQAGFNFGEWSKVNLPTFRGMLGLTEGTAGGRNVAHNVAAVKRTAATPARGARPVQARGAPAGKKPVRPQGWGEQPNNPYSVFSNA